VGDGRNVLQHDVARPLRADNLHDVEEERPTDLVAHAKLEAGLRERLAWWARDEHICVSGL